MSIHKPWRFGFVGAIGACSCVLAVTAIMTAAASARTEAAPQSSSAPTISGQLREGRKVFAHNGTWSSSPTSFAYQWQLCDGSGGSCAAISGATSQSYTVASGNADHTLRVVVTASNSDGSSSATSQATSVVSSSGGPNNTASPTISGTPKVGEQLTASTGTWTGGVRSFAYQWQRCETSGNSCTAVADATAKVYGVRTIDAGNTIRVVVTATNLSGSSTATSAPTAKVVTSGSTPPVTHRNHAPSITFVGLRRLGHRVYARFSLCDDGTKNVTVIEHDAMPGRLGYTRRFSIAPKPCGTHAKSWMLIPRFRHAGRFTTSLRAVDKSGASSRTVHRTLFFHHAL